MGAPAQFVIIGAGMSGALTAQALREQGFQGRLLLIGDEADRPYERPPLSKSYLMRKSDREGIFVHPPEWYADNDVELRLNTRAESLDRGMHEVVLASGETLPYDALLLATGAEPRRLSTPGADLRGVHYLRRVHDSEELREGFAAASRIVVVGGGWIGLETAAAARTAGVEVTVLERDPLPLFGVLGEEMATVFANLHRDNGVDLRVNAGLEQILEDDGNVAGVHLDDGSRVDGQIVIIGVGVLPNTALAESGGLAVDNGVLVDQHLRTSDPDIAAVGDIANAEHPILHRRVRVEHWANARRQPPVAASTMLGKEAVYDRLPYFFSDQYDLGMEYTGFASPGDYDEVVVRGDVERREFLAFWLSDGKALAGMNVNIWDVNPEIEELVLSGRSLDPQRLTDPAIPLKEV